MKEYFYNNLAYEVIFTKTSIFGITALLKSPSGNWIVANGINIRDRKDISGNTIFFGDWDHGHYFMENKTAAEKYFNSVSVHNFWD